MVLRSNAIMLQMCIIKSTRVTEIAAVTVTKISVLKILLVGLIYTIMIETAGTWHRPDHPARQGTCRCM